MLNTFKNRIGDREFSFYRTTNLRDDVVYFIMYTFDEERLSVKVLRDGKKGWALQSELQTELTEHEDQLLYCIQRNEGGLI